MDSSRGTGETTENLPAWDLNSCGFGSGRAGHQAQAQDEKDHKFDGMPHGRTSSARRLILILAIHFPPVAHGAHFDFLERIVNGV